MRTRAAGGWAGRNDTLPAGVLAGGSTCQHVRVEEERDSCLWLLGGDRDESGADGAALGIDGHAAGGHGDEGRGNIETLQSKKSHWSALVLTLFGICRGTL